MIKLIFMHHRFGISFQKKTNKVFSFLFYSINFCFTEPSVQNGIKPNKSLFVKYLYFYHLTQAVPAAGLCGPGPTSWCRYLGSRWRVCPPGPPVTRCRHNVGVQSCVLGRCSPESLQSHQTAVTATTLHVKCVIVVAKSNLTATATAEDLNISVSYSR